MTLAIGTKIEKEAIGHCMKNRLNKIDPKLLEILVCPLTKGTLIYDPDAQELISEQAHLAYPIRDGIPIMLIDEARTLDKV